MDLKTYLFCLNEDIDIKEFENLDEEEEVKDEAPLQFFNKALNQNRRLQGILRTNPNVFGQIKARARAMRHLPIDAAEERAYFQMFGG